jgi:hypothetical protein
VKSVSSFRLAMGSHIDPKEIRGYYIDLREKAEAAAWPPPWFPFPGFHRYIAVGQFGLGAYERYLFGDGDAWLAAAVAAGEHLVEAQVQEGHRAGAWEEPEPYRHTFRMRGPWVSAMAQGHCASLLVRLHRATGGDAFAEAALRALLPYRSPVTSGGVQALLDGRPFPEEYPTDPASYVLNGAIYAIWGVYDVAVGLGDADARAELEELVDTVAENIYRWDLGYWSRYDLYPHPMITNVASASYHALHVNQLRALDLLTPRPALADAAARFDRYANRPVDRLRGLVHKVAFRLVVPRNQRIAQRLPWTHPEQPQAALPAHDLPKRA